MSTNAGLKAEWLAKGYEDFTQGLNGLSDSPVSSLRVRAFNELQDKGFESTKTESWKYTNVRDLMKLPLSIVKGKVNEVSDSLTPYCFSDEQAFVVVVQDGVPLKLPQELPSGVRIRSLADVLHSASEATEVKEFIKKFPTEDTHAFELLNTAFLKDGIVIDIEAGVVLERVIQIVYASSATSTHIVQAPRLLVRMQANATAEIVEHFVGLGARHYLMSAVAQVEVGAGARCNHYKIQEEGAEATHVGAVSVLQDSSSHYKNFVFNFGGQMVRNEVRPVLNGTEINSELFGLNILVNDQFVDNFTILDHAQPDSESNELYKGIYGGSSKAIFSGTIIVRPGAHGTNAIQSNQSLLVTDRASSNSRPQLKIWADDVKCTHGATVGQIDEEALFYLRSRGLSENVARRLLMRAFVGEVVAEVDSDVVRSYVDSVVER
ncbi:MAG: Fe-S cluster assembly protein SufD, partial [Bdellovibrionales bacterium]|nr:Fe-S cluster assembly protein SufD [Bdellovibrionales bacterium]